MLDCKLARKKCEHSALVALHLTSVRPKRVAGLRREKGKVTREPFFLLLAPENGSKELEVAHRAGRKLKRVKIPKQS